MPCDTMEDTPGGYDIPAFISRLVMKGRSPPGGYEIPAFISHLVMKGRRLPVGMRFLLSSEAEGNAYIYIQFLIMKMHNIETLNQDNDPMR